MLELRDVHTHYGLSHVLQGVSLRVGAGEVVGLFGRNGVGKTTVMKTIAGWVAPSRGSVLLEGQPIGGLPPERICRRGIGFVPEDRRIFPGLTVQENLVLGFMQSPGRSRAEDRRSLDAIYSRFPRLGERRGQMGTTLSGGEQQMLAIARALMLRPRLMLLDEPSFGLAPLVVKEMFEILTALNREEKASMLIVEQNAALALGIADEAYLLETGSIVMSGPAKQIGADENVRRSYLGY